MVLCVKEENEGYRSMPKNDVKKVKTKLKHKKHQSNVESSTDGQNTLFGYSALPYHVKADSSVTHYIYCKPYNPDHITTLMKYQNRILLILSVPPFADKNNLGSMMSAFGDVEDVFLANDVTSQLHPQGDSKDAPQARAHFPTASQSITRGFKVAYVVYRSSKYVKQFSSITNKPKAQPLILHNPPSKSNDAQQTAAPPLLTGLRRYISEYNNDVKKHSDVESLEREVDEYMAEYDKKKAAAVEVAGEAAGEDDDGWVTVTRRTRHGPGTAASSRAAAPRSEAHTRRIMARERKKRQQKELLNFYTFQIREGKKNRVKELRQKFEEDKKRVAMMKAARKFKPH